MPCSSIYPTNAHKKTSEQRLFEGFKDGWP
jgi:hypothetical protein